MKPGGFVRLLLPLAIAAFVGLLAARDMPASALAPALHEQIFVDEERGVSMSVQLDVAAPDAGHFTFRVPAVGVYAGDARAEMRSHSRREVEIDFRGVATLRTLSAGSTGTTRQIRLQAHIDPDRHRAEAKLRDGENEFRLDARPADIAGLAPAVDAVERAVVSNDPAALYPLLNARAASAVSAGAFVAQWNKESASTGRITALRRLSLGSPEVTDQGFTFVAVEYSADVSAPTGPSTTSFTAFFIHEPGGWRLWTTVRK